MGLDIQKFSGPAPNYTITKVNHMVDYIGGGGDGPKPSGMICIDGVLYLAFQNLLRNRIPVFGLQCQHGSDAQIIYSIDKGGTWIPALGNIKAPMFPGHLFGSPAFINYGQNHANARDQFVYAVSGDQWDNGCNLRLGRVPADRIMYREAWEWVCGFTPAQQPAWHASLEDAVPVLSLYRWLSLPEMVYLASIQRYLLFTWHFHKDFSPIDGTDLIIFEAPEPWGPFNLVHFEEDWEGQEITPYCPRLPLKWLEADGLTGWLQFSGTWHGCSLPGSPYRSHIRPFRLKLR